MKITDAKTRQSDELNHLIKPRKGGRPSVVQNSFRGEFFKIPTQDIIPYKHQARKSFDEEELKNLAQTIKRFGIRQPLTVMPTPDNEGKYEVISGERRLKAAKIAGLERVPCIILENRDCAQEISVIENTQRSDLHPIELGEAYHKLLDNGLFDTQDSLAKELGAIPSRVSELLSFSTMPDEIKNLALKKKITNRSILRKLTKVNNFSEAQELVKHNTQSIKRKKSKRYSILRVILTDNGLEVNHSGLNRLNNTSRTDLKAKLSELLEIIDES